MIQGAEHSMWRDYSQHAVSPDLSGIRTSSNVSSTKEQLSMLLKSFQHPYGYLPPQPSLLSFFKSLVGLAPSYIASAAICWAFVAGIWPHTTSVRSLLANLESSCLPRNSDQARLEILPPLMRLFLVGVVIKQGGRTACISPLAGIELGI